MNSALALARGGLRRFTSSALTGRVVSRILARTLYNRSQLMKVSPRSFSTSADDKAKEVVDETARHLTKTAQKKAAYKAKVEARLAEKVAQGIVPKKTVKDATQVAAITKQTGVKVPKVDHVVGTEKKAATVKVSKTPKAPKVAKTTKDTAPVVTPKKVANKTTSTVNKKQTDKTFKASTEKSTTDTTTTIDTAVAKTRKPRTPKAKTDDDKATVVAAGKKKVIKKKATKAATDDATATTSATTDATVTSPKKPYDPSAPKASVLRQQRLLLAKEERLARLKAKQDERNALIAGKVAGRGTRQQRKDRGLKSKTTVDSDNVSSPFVYVDPSLKVFKPPKQLMELLNEDQMQRLEMVIRASQPRRIKKSKSVTGGRSSKPKVNKNELTAEDIAYFETLEKDAIPFSTIIKDGAVIPAMKVSSQHGSGVAAAVPKSTYVHVPPAYTAEEKAAIRLQRKEIKDFIRQEKLQAKKEKAGVLAQESSTTTTVSNPYRATLRQLAKKSRKVGGKTKDAKTTVVDKTKAKAVTKKDTTTVTADKKVPFVKKDTTEKDTTEKNIIFPKQAKQVAKREAIANNLPFTKKAPVAKAPVAKKAVTEKKVPFAKKDAVTKKDVVAKKDATVKKDAVTKKDATAKKDTTEKKDVVAKKDSTEKKDVVKKDATAKKAAATKKDAATKKAAATTTTATTEATVGEQTENAVTKAVSDATTTAATSTDAAVPTTVPGEKVRRARKTIETVVLNEDGSRTITRTILNRNKKKRIIVSIVRPPKPLTDEQKAKRAAKNKAQREAKKAKKLLPPRDPEVVKAQREAEKLRLEELRQAKKAAQFPRSLMSNKLCKRLNRRRNNRKRMQELIAAKIIRRAKWAAIPADEKKIIMDKRSRAGLRKYHEARKLKLLQEKYAIRREYKRAQDIAQYIAYSRSVQVRAISSKTENGTLEWYDMKSGFGKILRPDGEQIYFCKRDVDVAGNVRLQRGTLLNYRLAYRTAPDVSSLDAEAAAIVTKSVKHDTQAVAISPIVRMSVESLAVARKYLGRKTALETAAKQRRKRNLASWIELIKSRQAARQAAKQSQNVASV